MAATDLVPCFYTGQDYRIERPADVLTRAEVRELKAQKRGMFIESGKIFLFSEKRQKGGQPFFDGWLGRGNILPFARVSNPICKPETINYPVPMAGDAGCFSRHRRRLIHVSGRSKFPQILPHVASTTASASCEVAS